MLDAPSTVDLTAKGLLPGAGGYAVEPTSGAVNPTPGLDDDEDDLNEEELNKARILIDEKYQNGDIV